MAHMTAVLRQLEQERIRLTARLDQVDKALAALSGGRTIKKRRLSAAALARIRSAQKARWAKWRKTHKKKV